jgi:DNA-binding response OmpR family regulator
VRVLLVEDEASLADAVAAALALDGFAVDVARNGVDGAHQALEHPYAAVVLDIMLPGLSGYGVLRRMREARVWTPVLMLTAKDGEYDIADALDLGADDYLVKPFAHVVLVARLRALIRRGLPARPAVLRVGDLAVDPATRSARLRGEPVRLTSREFAVLEYLARHADRVVSKHELLTGVWDEHFDGDPNIIEVYVGYLRRKLGDRSGPRRIETVRGAGYRLRGDPG